jgi:hypothetical protein
MEETLQVKFFPVFIMAVPEPSRTVVFPLTTIPMPDVEYVAAEGRAALLLNFQ